MSATSQVSRASRAWRGFAAALFSTLCAAGSHAVAGGQITWLAIIATVLLSLPVCVGLAGKLGSLGRIAAAIGFSQFLFHWSFSGIGAGSHHHAAMSSLSGPHAHHGTVSPLLIPELAASSQGMWMAHLAAALTTTLLLAYGERAALALGTIVHHRVFPRKLGTLTLQNTTRQPPTVWAAVQPIAHFRNIACITHRGPPRASRYLITPAVFSA